MGSRMGLTKLLDGWLHAALKKRGYVLMRQLNPNHYLGRRMKLFRSYGIDVVFDVGANSGQYARRLRSLGYKGRILSFEPMRTAFAELAAAAATDKQWECLQLGLSDADGTSVIHISENSVSSSTLPMLDRHSMHAPMSRYVGEEQIELRRFDALCRERSWPLQNSWLKIDVQGLEHRVIEGASAVLGDLAALQVEISLVPLYEGQMILRPMLEMLADKGFDLVGFEPGFDDKRTGEYLQFDGIFRNRKMRERGIPPRP